MLFRILIIFGFYISFSQNEITPQSVLNNSLDLSDSFFFENNNIGDPIILLFPKVPSNDFLLNHVSNNVRRVDFFKINFSTINDQSISNIYYESCYNEGGLIKGSLSRPVGKNMFLNFFYHNLSSTGYYNHQKNKYSHLFFSLDFFSKKIPYFSTFSLKSLNAQYEQNGGLVNYNATSDFDLLETYITSAVTNIKKRVLDFKHHYVLNQDFKINHQFSIEKFERDYNDPNPVSFYYTLTPLDYLIISDYNLSDNMFNIYNRISLAHNSFKLGLDHHHYNTNSLSSEKLKGDFIFSFVYSNLFIKNIDLNASYCFSGYNKNNFLGIFNFDKKLKHFSHFLEISYKQKKPDFFTRHYDNMFSFNWLGFSSINSLTLKTISTVEKRNLNASLYFNRLLNFFYFNEIATPVQFTQPLSYFKFNLTKNWSVGRFLFKTDLILQHSDNNVLSVPSILYSQKVSYNYILSKNLRLSTSIKSSIFSSYYPNAFFPLTDVFYQQRLEKSKVAPFFAVDIFLQKKQFSFGLIFDHIHSFYVDNIFVTPNYFTPPANLRFSVNWIFFD